MTEQYFDELERAVASLNKNIADFPIGAISINDLKPTEERIRDMRDSLKALNAKMLMLRAKTAAQTLSVLPEGDEQDTYNEMQGKIAHSLVDNISIKTLLQNSASAEILESSEQNESSERLKILMQSLFITNDRVMSLERTIAEESAKELELKCELQESLSEFRDFLKLQENIREKKLEETNPEIARQKESIHRRLEKINIMKRLITNLAAASAGVVKDNPILQEMWKKHRELLSAETVQEMAKELDLKN